MSTDQNFFIQSNNTNVANIEPLNLKGKPITSFIPEDDDFQNQIGNLLADLQNQLENMSTIIDVEVKKPELNINFGDKMNSKKTEMKEKNEGDGLESDDFKKSNVILKTTIKTPFDDTLKNTKEIANTKSNFEENLIDSCNKNKDNDNHKNGDKYLYTNQLTPFDDVEPGKSADDLNNNNLFNDNVMSEPINFNQILDVEKSNEFKFSNGANNSNLNPIKLSTIPEKEDILNSKPQSLQEEPKVSMKDKCSQNHNENISPSKQMINESNIEFDVNDIISVNEENEKLKKEEREMEKEMKEAEKIREGKLRELIYKQQEIAEEEKFNGQKEKDEEKEENLRRLQEEEERLKKQEQEKEEEARKENERIIKERLEREKKERENEEKKRKKLKEKLDKEQKEKEEREKLERDLKDKEAKAKAEKEKVKTDNEDKTKKDIINDIDIEVAEIESVHSSDFEDNKDKINGKNKKEITKNNENQQTIIPTQPAATSIKESVKIKEIDEKNINGNKNNDEKDKKLLTSQHKIQFTSSSLVPLDVKNKEIIKKLDDETKKKLIEFNKKVNDFDTDHPDLSDLKNYKTISKLPNGEETIIFYITFVETF